MTAVRQLKVLPKQTARRLKLTEQVVSSIKEGERVYDAGGPPGFFAQGLRDGKVSFRVLADIPTAARRYGLPKKTMERVVGRWPDDLSPKAARTLAGEFIAAIKRGEDPSPKTAIAPVASWTIQEAFDEYVGSYLTRQGVPDSTKRTYGFNFQRLPLKWQSRPMREMITDVDGLKSLHELIRKGILAKTENKTEDTGKNSADATINLLAILANYSRGKDPTLPAWIPRAIDKHGPRDRSGDGFGLSEVGPWWDGVQNVKNETKRWLGLFILTTGLREGDAMTATLEHLNEAEKTLFLPEPKGHRLNRPGRDRSFTMPLSEIAMTTILRARAIRIRKVSNLLFPNPITGKPFTDSKLEYNGTRLADGHKLRHAFATIAEDLGVDESTRARLLNHKSKTETARYSNPRKVTAPLRVAVDLIGAAIAKEIGL
jgi:integrase